MIKAVGLISPILVPLIVSGLLFFSSEKRNKPKLFLAFYMLLIAYIFLANYFYFEHNYNVYIYLHSLHIATVLAIYPGAYIYIRLLTYSEGNKRRAFLHLLPSLLFFLLSAGIFFPFLSVEERCTFLSDYRFNPDFSQTWMKILYYVRMANIMVLFVQVVLYLILIWRMLQQHRTKVNDIFSNPEKFQLNWLRSFNIALALSAFVCVFMYTVNPVKLFGDDRYLSYPLLIVAVILWFLGIMGNNQTALPELQSTGERAEGSKGAGELDKCQSDNNTGNIPRVDVGVYQSIKKSISSFVRLFVSRASPDPFSEHSEAQKRVSRRAECEALLVKLEQHFRQEKPYLNSDLTIYDVAKDVGTNRTYISQIINNEYGKNFSSYVNSFRLEEAKRIIDEGGEETLLEIADDCGFGSVSSLGRCFRGAYGVSISAYKCLKVSDGSHFVT